MPPVSLRRNTRPQSYGVQGLPDGPLSFSTHTVQGAYNDYAFCSSVSLTTARASVSAHRLSRLATADTRSVVKHRCSWFHATDSNAAVEPQEMSVEGLLSMYWLAKVSDSHPMQPLYLHFSCQASSCAYDSVWGWLALIATLCCLKA